MRVLSIRVVEPECKARKCMIPFFYSSHAKVGVMELIKAIA